MSKFILIAGPCVIEDEDCVMQVAETVKGIAERLDLDYYFKASFDKANRTSLSSYRGPGIDKGLEILKKGKRSLRSETCDRHTRTVAGSKGSGSSGYVADTRIPL